MRLIGSTFAICLLVFGCGGDENPPAIGTGGAPGAGGRTSDGGPNGSGGSGSSVSTPPFGFGSSVFSDGQTVPQEYRCQAPSPDLTWSGGPAAKSYAIVMKDVTPGFANGTLHWVIFDIPSTVHSLPEGVPVGYAPAAPAGAHQAPIYNGTKGFTGPCGGNNTYELTLHAVDVATLPGVTEASTGPAAVTAIEAHSMADITMTVLSHP
jgi:phosphatidylethanolamine-binding protein (PEBP) family uncharacterized protein